MTDSEEFEVLSTSERWKPDPLNKGDWTYEDTQIILKQTSTGDLFYSHTPVRCACNTAKLLELVELNTLQLTRIPESDIYPLLEENEDIIPASPAVVDDLEAKGGLFLKQQSLMGYGEDGLSMQKALLDEIRVCQLLQKSPHPNIAKYYGCAVNKNNRITGLYFRKYEQSLADRVKDGPPFDHEICLRDVEDGLTHLHGLGFVHNDVNPANIMFDEDGRAVIIDFDSCRREGEKLGKGKAGTMGYADETAEVARRENDWFSLGKVRDFLQSGLETV